MKIRIKIVLSCFCFFCMAVVHSCQSKLNDNEYISYVTKEENGLRKIIKVGEWIYDIQYKPLRYILLKEQVLKNDQIEKRKKQLQGTIWFNIKIKHVDETADPLKYKVSGIEEYNQRLDYFLNKVSKQISLEYNAIKLEPISYLFEYNYSLTPDQTMIIGFEIPDESIPNGEMTLIYNDEIFKNGIIKSRFDKKDIHKSNNL